MRKDRHVQLYSPIGRPVRSLRPLFLSVLFALLGGLGLPAVAQAAIAYVQSNDSAPASASTVTVTYSSAQGAGDMNVVAIGWVDATSSVTSVTDTRGNTYVRALGPTTVSGTASQSIYYALNIAASAAGTNTVTVNFSATVPNPDMRILEYSGIATANALDKTAGASSATGTALNSGSATTTNANDLILGSDLVAYGIAAAGSGYTQRVLSAGNTEEDQIVTGTGSYSATAAQSPSGWWIMQLTAFKGAGTPPNAPTGLTATAASSSQINLAWTASTGGVGGATGYRVERCAGPGCSTFTQVGTSTTASYADTGVSASTSYTYRVRASDTLGDLSGYSGTATATTGSGSTAIGYVQSNGAAPASASTVTVTYSSAQSAGDLNVVAVGWVNTTASVSSVTDSKGNTYLRAVGPTTASGTATESIYYAQNITAAAAGANTVTVTFSTAVPNPDVRILEYSGIATANALDVAVGAGSTTGTALNSGSVTTTNASDLLIGSDLVAYGVSAAGSGYTQRDLSAGNTDEDKIVTNTGSYSAAATQSPSGWWIMQLTAFKSASVSASGTTIPSASSIVDSSYNTWTVSGGVVYKNGTAAGYTANVILLLYYNGTIYQENSAGSWWSWSGSAWTAVSGDPRVSASGTTIPSATQIVDSAHNVWTVTGGVIYENGAAAGYSANVSVLLYYNGIIYQENSSGSWWSWNGNAWVAESGDPRSSGGPSSAGVQVGIGANGGILVRSDTGAPVFLIGMGISGLENGPTELSNGWTAISAVSSAQWALGLQQWKNSLPSAAQPYGQINTIRIAVNSAAYMGYTGISPDGGTLASNQYPQVGTDANGRALYCGSTTGGGPGSGVGHEASGDPTAYRNIVDTTINNFLGASSIVGYPLYVLIDLHFSSPVHTGTGQIIMPVGQFMSQGEGDIAFWQAIAAKYGANKQVLVELFNELYGSANSTGLNTPTESKWFGNGNNNPVTFEFPTAATSPYNNSGGTGGGSGSYTDGYLYNFGTGLATINGKNTAQIISWQQALNAYRAAGGTNVVIVGVTSATEHLDQWSYNGGNQTVVDPYTVGGIRQMAASFHAYTSNQTNQTQQNAIVSAGVPFMVTEAGQITAGPGGSGGNSAAVPGSSYVYYQSHFSGYMWWTWATFDNVTNLYDGTPTTFTISAEPPWNNFNVPTNGPSTNQVPTGSN